MDFLILYIHLGPDLDPMEVIGGRGTQMMGARSKSSPFVVLMAWICKGIIFVHIWAFIVVLFSEPCTFHGLTVWSSGPVECQGSAMFVGTSRTCPLLVFYEFSCMQDSSCSRSVKWCKMHVKLGQRTFPCLPQGVQSWGTLCWKGFLPWTFICTLGSPGWVCIQHCPFSGQGKLGAVIQHLLSKRNST